MVWQPSTLGHTELTQIVSFYTFLNVDPAYPPTWVLQMTADMYLVPLTLISNSRRNL
jgi:hypothetical protein